MSKVEVEKLSKMIRSIQDFPEKGILFRDITTALKDKEGLKLIIEDFTNRYKDKGIDYVLGADARGFIFGAAIAYNIGAGFVPARKVGKLPADTIRVDYELEYGINSIEMHTDAIPKGAKVLIVDDLVEIAEAKVYELAFLIELVDLKGREKLHNNEVYSILKY